MVADRTSPLTRRRFIHISAAAPGLALLPAADQRGTARAADDPGGRLRVWRGTALGADATMRINHPDPGAADRLIARCLSEVARLERVFSLYRPDSAISALNRAGRLDAPPIELVELLGASHQFSRLTGGAFDITVQPLWDLYAAHFATAGADPAGPARALIAAALRQVGADGVEVAAVSIRFRRPGMRITLNGIAQGAITDRVVALLRAEGIDRSLVDMGEVRALGPRPDGTPWRVGLEDPAAPGTVNEHLAIVNQAVATSGGYGTPLDPAGRFNHIFDPATGATSTRYRRVSVVAPTAATADALSTGFSLMPLAATQPIVDRLGLRAHFVMADGRLVVQSPRSRG